MLPWASGGLGSRAQLDARANASSVQSSDTQGAAACACAARSPLEIGNERRLRAGHGQLRLSSHSGAGFSHSSVHDCLLFMSLPPSSVAEANTDDWLIRMRRRWRLSAPLCLPWEVEKCSDPPCGHCDSSLLFPAVARAIVVHREVGAVGTRAWEHGPSTPFLPQSSPQL